METASLKDTIFNMIGSRYIFTILFTKEFFSISPYKILIKMKSNIEKSKITCATMQ